jgi:hypothetical protein
MTIAQILKDKARRAAPIGVTRLSPLKKIVLALLFAAASSAGLFAAYALLGPEGADTPISAPEWKPPTLAVGELDPPKPAAADVQALSRPLFTKNRRPPPKVANVPAVPDAFGQAAAPNGYTVSAIMTDKKKSQAYIVSGESLQGAWKKVGETVDSWTVSAINPADLILKSGSQSMKLKLYGEPQQ